MKCVPLDMSLEAPRVTSLASKWSASKKKIRREIEKFLSKAGAKG
jgi:hypothetical protein